MNHPIHLSHIHRMHNKLNTQKKKKKNRCTSTRDKTRLQSRQGKDAVERIARVREKEMQQSLPTKMAVFDGQLNGIKVVIIDLK